MLIQLLLKTSWWLVQVIADGWRGGLNFGRLVFGKHCCEVGEDLGDWIVLLVMVTRSPGLRDG